jgi:exosortase/archaeosortase family protein
LIYLFFSSHLGFLQLLSKYLFLIIRPAVFQASLQLGKIFGVNLILKNWELFVNNNPYITLSTSYMGLWIIIVFFLIWIIKVKLKEKILFSLLVILLYYFLSVFQIIGYAMFQDSGYAKTESTAIIDIITNLLFFFFICGYIYKNRVIVYAYFRDYIIYSQFTIVLWHIFIALIIALFMLFFIPEYFNLSPWIKGVIVIANKILAIMGYNSEIDVPYLMGQYGNVEVNLGCLGIKTMLIYALVIYFTGVKLFSKLVFIILGLILFYFLNIFRIVFVFINLQIYKSYEIAVSVHDFLKYPVYLIIIMIWVVWLNKYSDIWSYLKKQPLNS